MVPTDNSLGNSWTGDNKPFSDAIWIGGLTGVGHESGQVQSMIAAPIAYWTFDELLFGGTVATDELERYDGKF